MRLVKTVIGRDFANNYKFEVFKDGHLLSLHGYKNNEEKNMFLCHIVDEMKKANSVINEHIVFDKKTIKPS